MSMDDALFAALAAHDLGAVAAALAAGADADAVQAEYPRFSALDAAIEELEDGGPLDALVLLLRAGAHVDARDGAGDSTPLLMAIFRDQPAAARLLLAAGADPTARGSEGDTPLSFCAERGWVELATLLLHAGAAATIDAPAGPAGMNPLGCAAVRLQPEMVALLLAHGARPDALDADRMTAADRLRATPAAPDDDDAKTRREAILRLLAPAAG
jgi:hypothetical protein